MVKAAYPPKLDRSLLHLHLSHNREDRWGTAGDFTTSFLHRSLFSIALWDLASSRPVHSRAPENPHSVHVHALEPQIHHLHFNSVREINYLLKSVAWNENTL